jgi:hypothetical protein
MDDISVDASVVRNMTVRMQIADSDWMTNNLNINLAVKKPSKNFILQPLFSYLAPILDKLSLPWET